MTSPCVSVCRLDADKMFCTGCGRTIQEITDWSKLTAEQQAAVWDRLFNTIPPEP